LNQRLLFTDGSVHPESSIGFGAYLLVPNPGLSLELLKAQVRVKRFEDTTSSKLELQTLLWALGELNGKVKKIKVYTDSQTIIGLPARRDRMERNAYYTTKGILLKNAALYRAFFQITEQLDCVFEKIKGHQQASKKEEIDQLFTLVDRASRNALRGSSRHPSSEASG
jgi:ribonuclease HI